MTVLTETGVDVGAEVVGDVVVGGGVVSTVAESTLTVVPLDAACFCPVTVIWMRCVPTVSPCTAKRVCWSARVAEYKSTVLLGPPSTDPQQVRYVPTAEAEADVITAHGALLLLSPAERAATTGSRDSGPES